MSETFEQLDARLRSDGWQRGYPPRGGLIDGVAIDRQVCQESPCEECSYDGGLQYYSYVDPERRISRSGYSAVWRCPRCNCAMEF
jgi:hypothetical protein